MSYPAWTLSDQAIVDAYAAQLTALGLNMMVAQPPVIAYLLIFRGGIARVGDIWSEKILERASPPVL